MQSCWIIEVEKLTNKKLIEYVHQWWAVPYRIGGNSKEGIDCSAFVQGLTSEAYGLSLPRTSREQADFCKEISKAGPEGRRSGFLCRWQEHFPCWYVYLQQQVCSCIHLHGGRDQRFG